MDPEYDDQHTCGAARGQVDPPQYPAEIAGPGESPRVYLPDARAYYMMHTKTD